MLCLIDDAQWLDQASALALAFVARRLLAEPVGVVFATRERGEERQQVRWLEVRGLSDGDARALLGSAVRFMLDAPVRDQIIAELRGNPLAVLELPRGLTATQLASGFATAGTEALPSKVEESFVRRVDALPLTPDACCYLPWPSPSGIRCCSGGRPSGSVSGRKPPTVRTHRSYWQSASG